MQHLLVTFYYKDKGIYDPDWDRKIFILPNVGDEVFLKNTYEDQYEKYWYTVRKRRWINDNLVRIYLEDERWTSTN